MVHSAAMGRIWIAVAVVGALVFAAAGFVWSRVPSRVDHLLAAFATVGSLTWNTETLSAFLLVGVGLLFGVLSLRMRGAVSDAQRSLGS